MALNIAKCNVLSVSRLHTTSSFVEYASCAWDPHTDSHINQIEMIQHRAVRFILNQYSWQESITEMINTLNFDTLQSRRKNARLCLFFKIHKQLTPLIAPEELRIKAEQRRTDNGRAYEHFTSHTNPLYSSFYPRTVRDWNLLPSHLVSLSSINSFADSLGYQRPANS